MQLRSLSRLLVNLFLIISLLTNVSFAQNFMASYTVNNGGLNTKASNFALKDNESPDCQNVYFAVDGGIVKRGGFTELDATSLNTTEDVTGIYQYTQSDGDTWLIATAGNKVGQSTSFATVSWTNITGAATITAGYLFDFDSLNNIVVMTNGKDVPLKWTGADNVSSAAVPTDLTKAKWVASFQNFMFYANVTVGGTVRSSRVYWSGIKDPDTWNSLDFVDISVDDGEDIMGMEVLGDRLAVFKESSIYNLLFTGDPDIPFIVQESAGSTGSASGYSIVGMGAGLLFLSYDGLYVYDGMYTEKISYNVDTVFNTDISPGDLDTCVGDVYDDLNQYWLTWTRSGQSSNDRVLIWDYFNGSFSLYKGISANYLSSVSVDGDSRLFSGHYDGHLYRQGSGLNDDGVAIEAYYWTKWFDFGNPVLTKRITNMVVYLDDVGDYAVNIGYNWDFNDGVWRSVNVTMTEVGTAVVGTAIVGTAIAGGTGGVVERIDVSGSGKVTRFRFHNSGLNEEFHIRGFGLVGEMLGVR